MTLKSEQFFGSDLYLRPATAEDAAFLFALRNDPGTRENSFHHEEIIWEQHIDWLERLLQKPDRMQFILTDGSRSLGQVRVDLSRDHMAESDEPVAATVPATQALAGDKDGSMSSDPQSDALSAEISYSIAPDCRGMGLGSVAINLAQEKAVQSKIRQLTAQVLPENRASIRIFEKCGFTSCK